MGKTPSFFRNKPLVVAAGGVQTRSQSRRCRRRQEDEPARKAARRQPKVAASAGKQDQAIPHLTNAAVLRPLISSGFFRTVDLGRLLLLTSRRIRKAIMEAEDQQDSSCFSSLSSDNFCYKCLMGNHVGEKIAQTLLGSTGLHPKQCFLALVYHSRPPPVTQSPFHPRPLRYQPSDYTLLLQARNSKTDQLLFYHTMPGEEVSGRFWDLGMGTVHLDDEDSSSTAPTVMAPVIVEEPGRHNDTITIYNQEHLVTPPYTINVQLYRHADQRVLSLLHIYRRRDVMNRNSLTVNGQRNDRPPAGLQLLQPQPSAYWKSLCQSLGVADGSAHIPMDVSLTYARQQKTTTTTTTTRSSSTGQSSDVTMIRVASLEIWMAPRYGRIRMNQYGLPLRQPEAGSIFGTPQQQQRPTITLAHLLEAD